MTTKVKYTVKYHPRPVKKIATVFFSCAAIIIFLLDLIWTPFKSLTPDLQALTIFYLLPEMYFHLHIIAFLSMLIGFGLWIFRWRSGTIELTEEKLVINGSYHVSIWLKNMWEVDVRDYKYNRWRILLDSNVDAVQVKFRAEKEFEEFSERLVRLVGQVDNVKFKTMTD